MSVSASNPRDVQTARSCPQLAMFYKEAGGTILLVTVDHQTARPEYQVLKMKVLQKKGMKFKGLICF